AAAPARSAAWKSSRSPITRARSEPRGVRSIARRLRLPCRECQTSRLLAGDDTDLVTALDGRRLAAREDGPEELAEPQRAARVDGVGEHGGEGGGGVVGAGHEDCARGRVERGAASAPSAPGASRLTTIRAGESSLSCSARSSAGAITST